MTEISVTSIAYFTYDCYPKPTVETPYTVMLQDFLRRGEGRSSRAI